MNDKEKYWMGQAMEVYGGSFVQSLKRCLECADSWNFQRIVNAFPEIIEQYTEMGKTMKEKSEKEGGPG
jgi:hypothetical protein